MSAGRPYLTSREAASALGISLPTLYAYASRGQLRSEAVPGRPRERRYSSDDVDHLRERQEARRDPAGAAARGLHWGCPVLESGLTLIRESRVYYRGRDVLALARSATLEDVARLLWSARDGERLFDSRASSPPLAARPHDRLVRLQCILPLAADAAAYDLRPAAVRRAGARILRLAAAVISGRDICGPVHLALAHAWSPSAAEAIRTALVLCADHELNVSAFTARCAASAGASPYEVVSAALATFKGSRHGGATARVAALFAESGTSRHARAVIADRLRRGETLPGFGHPLYPAGDPRAALLLGLAKAGPNQEAWSLAHALQCAHQPPNLDFGLVALARAFNLPTGAPVLIFALGRIVGWIAHAIEQYGSGDLIRPRARYTGPDTEAPSG